MSDVSDLPVPEPSLETEAFWAAAREERLVIPRCEDCGFHWFPPSLACPRCGSEHYSWIEASGRGTVFSFTIYHRLYHDAFKHKIPYVVAIIALEEGPRLISNVVGIAADKVRCDMPVQVVFDSRAGGVKVPQFAPSETPPS